MNIQNKVLEWARKPNWHAHPRDGFFFVRLIFEMEEWEKKIEMHVQTE
jgi:hypothetical protein